MFPHKLFASRNVFAPFSLLMLHTREAVGKKILLPSQGATCPRSSAGATFMSTRALPRRSLPSRGTLPPRPSMTMSGPSIKCSSASLPEKVHMAMAPYICRLNCTPMDTPVKSTKGLARVNLAEMTSLRATRGSQGPSRVMRALHTGHSSGLLERSQSVTHDMMQSWCASSVQGHGFTQDEGGSLASSSVRQIKQRRGASIARGAVMASVASGGIVGREEPCRCDCDWASLGFMGFQTGRLRWVAVRARIGRLDHGKGN